MFPCHTVKWSFSCYSFCTSKFSRLDSNFFLPSISLQCITYTQHYNLILIYHNRSIKVACLAKSFGATCLVSGQSVPPSQRSKPVNWYLTQTPQARIRFSYHDLIVCTLHFTTLWLGRNCRHLTDIFFPKASMTIPVKFQTKICF